MHRPNVWGWNALSSWGNFWTWVWTLTSIGTPWLKPKIFSQTREHWIQYQGPRETEKESARLNHQVGGVTCRRVLGKSRDNGPTKRQENCHFWRDLAHFEALQVEPTKMLQLSATRTSLSPVPKPTLLQILWWDPPLERMPTPPNYVSNRSPC